jgi:hypothetical protein
MTYPLLAITVAIVSPSGEPTELRNGALLAQLTERCVWTVLGLRGRWCSGTSVEIRPLRLWLAIERRGNLLLGERRLMLRLRRVEVSWKPMLGILMLQ